ncbi:MAG: SDR family oxidoreductase, partial [Acidimicrobiia bacterium]|nr:SDR family oxidoreductase [Acidimicrobiia bacterium]
MGSTVLVTGATGYIGGRLVPSLVEAGHKVRCVVRSPGKLDDLPWRPSVEVVKGDADDEASMTRAMEVVDAAYYLLHSMGGGHDDFAARDRRLAETFRDAAAVAGLRQVIYLGGLGDDDDDLSAHLRSRHEVGAVLAEGPVPVTELRAAIIIGSGSASFEMLRHLTEVLPVVIAPRWVRTRCQPIAIGDVLHYLVGVLDCEGARGRVLDIGGPDVITYWAMMQVYAGVAGLRPRRGLPVPLLTPSLSSHWVGLVTPIPAGLARPLVDSLTNEVVVRNHTVEDLVPHETLPVPRAIELALEGDRNLDVPTSWAGAELYGRSPAEPQPSDPEWAGGTVLCDVKEVQVAASPRDVWETVTAIGGRRGWYAYPFLWALRGLVDRLLGGPGMRRGRRHPDQLRVGDTVDFWRVEGLERNRCLRLRAEMKVPGAAWLDFVVEPGAGGGGDRTTLRQTARFHPPGLWGRVYWYA